MKQPFGIPYGCMVSAQISNLMFAGRCVSVDAATLASIRVMPQCMSMGQAAGQAAAMAVSEHILPAQVDTQQLRRALYEQNAVLDMDQVNTIPVNEF